MAFSSPCLAYFLASVDLILPMALMRWVGLSLEAASRFEILGVRVNLQCRVGHLFQQDLYMTSELLHLESRSLRAEVGGHIALP